MHDVSVAKRGPQKSDAADRLAIAAKAAASFELLIRTFLTTNWQAALVIVDFFPVGVHYSVPETQ